MFALHVRRRLNLLAVAVIALFTAFIFWGRPITGLSAIVAVCIGVFIVVATCSVFIASRDNVTTMSLLPVWTGKKTEAGKQ